MQAELRPDTDDENRGQDQRAERPGSKRVGSNGYEHGEGR